MLLPVAFADFGTGSEAVYLSYLRSCENVATACGTTLAGVRVDWDRVCAGESGDSSEREELVGGVRFEKRRVEWPTGGSCGGSSQFGTGPSRVGGGSGETVGSGGGVGPAVAGVAEDVSTRGVCADAEGVRFGGHAGQVESGVKPGWRPGVGSGVFGPRRGPNYERNRLARERKKEAKRARVAVGADCRTRAPVLDVVCDNQEGFWNSCSARVRQELVDSKARMHIAENIRKAKEAEERVKQMESPEALLRRAMAMVTMAEECAKKGNDSKVAGWAQTVATSYAESIAKSAPSSVPSYASVSGSSTTSVSVDGTKRRKSQKKEYTVLEHRQRINGAGSPAQMEDACDVLAAATNLPTADKARLMNFATYRRQAICGPQVFA